MSGKRTGSDIAHHWQQFPLLWRFYLRPGIHFHHGRELEMEDVIAFADAYQYAFTLTRTSQR